MSSDLTALSEIEFIAVDLETTGLSPIACRIVEIGAVRFRLDGTELDRYEQLIDPRCAIPRGAMRIHGITGRMVAGMPTIAEALPEFIEFLGDASRVMVAHNATFDLGFLNVALAKNSVASPLHRVVDTLRLARRCIRDSRSFRLEDLAVHLGLAEFEEHRALADARLAAGLFRRSLERVRRAETVEDLFKFCRPLCFEDREAVLPELPVRHQELTVAIERQCTVVMVYEKGTRGVARRKITPRGLVQSKGRSYLYAYCHKDRIEKTYRLDRIRELRVEDS